MRVPDRAQEPLGHLGVPAHFALSSLGCQHCQHFALSSYMFRLYLPRWCHDPPDARVVAYFITLSSWSPPYARPRWCCGISHRNVSSLCLHSAALITAKTTAGATVGMLDVDAILPGGLRYTFDDGGCDHRPDPLALRPCRADLSWRSSSPAGEQSSSSWSTLATRMPGLVAIRVAVAAAVMNIRGSCHSGVALRVFFRARVRGLLAGEKVQGSERSRAEPDVYRSNGLSRESTPEPCYFCRGGVKR